MGQLSWMLQILVYLYNQIYLVELARPKYIERKKVEIAIKS